MKRTSLKDIARKLGVSTTLVSYVLNNKKLSRISHEIATKIRETAKELNYRPNQIAKSLKTNKTDTIGLIVSNISNPFSSNMARLIEDEAKKSNYTVLFGSSDESVLKFGNLINIFLNRQVDGFIIAPPENAESQLELLQKNEIPFVLIDRYFSSPETNYIVLDNFLGSQMAVNHVLEGGRKKIGLITYKSSLLHLLDRKAGYKALMETHNLPIHEQWIKELNLHVTSTEVENAINELLTGPEPVEAILFSSNTLASLGLDYINQLNIKVPSDLAVISFDEVEGSNLFYAPLTYIKQPLREMGQAATQVLLKLMEDKQELTRMHFEPELVIRKSTAPRAAAMTD